MSDDQFHTLNQQISDLADQFLKLYQHTEQRFDKIEAKMADREQVARLQVTMDGVAARLTADEQERAAMNHQLNRHENWIGRASQQLHVKYDRAA